MRKAFAISLTLGALGLAVLSGHAGGEPGDASASLVADINPGIESSFPGFSFANGSGNFINVNGTAYFTAETAAEGIELWKSDGTTATLIEDAVPGGGINPGVADSNPSELTNVNGTLFFQADDGSNGDELWKSDGTTATLIEDAVLGGGINPGAAESNPTNLTNVNGTLFFQATTDAEGRELWMSDGATATMVEDAMPGGGINPGAANSSPAFFTNFNGTLFFRATTDAEGVELWRLNGTTATMVEDAVPGGGINPGVANANPFNFTNFNGTLYFTATTAAEGAELWKLNGATAALVEDLNPGVASSAPFLFTNVNGTLFFAAITAAEGDELWKTDGTTVTLVEDVNPGIPDSAPTSLTGVNDTLFFRATTAAEGDELWMSDGTTATLVEDAVPGGGINPGAANSSPTSLTGVDDTLFFVATTAAEGVELWKSDGATATLVEDAVPGGGINPGVAGAPPEFLTNVDGTLFFAADDGNVELWKINGATATLVEDAVPGGGINNNPGDQGSFPNDLTNVDGTLFFAADDGTEDGNNGSELWKATVEGPPPVEGPTETPTGTPTGTPAPLPVPGNVTATKKCKKPKKKGGKGKKGSAAAKKGCKKPKKKRK